MANDGTVHLSRSQYRLGEIRRLVQSWIGGGRGVSDHGESGCVDASVREVGGIWIHFCEFLVIPSYRALISQFL